MTQTGITVGPVTAGQRSLAPDLARGLMLALIALANSVMYLYGRPYGIRQHIVEHGLLDRVVSVLDVALVDGRAYPMFTALSAYGVVQVYRAAGAGGREAQEAPAAAEPLDDRVRRVARGAAVPW